MKFMKKLLLFAAMLIIAGACSYDDNTAKFEVEFLPIESIAMPESMEPGHYYDITVYYKRPDDCHYFDGFYTEKDSQSEILAVQALVIQDANCISLEDQEPESATYNFKCPDNIGTSSYTSYEFKVYKGIDGSGNRIFETVEVPVGQ